MGEHDNREQGIEFGSLTDDLEDESYPMTHDEVLDRFGDRELELENGTTTVGEVLSEEMEREYEDAEGVRQTIFNMVGSAAVGRQRYSDRGGETPNEQQEGDDASM
ncbi:hypothetical protein G9C85_13980 [Halorubellus sp. JP-L1]|uniref:DUF5789 family protein n=1 Tax=Halorubellus sp. JP-L1 TaxID=2715753 RepID=UPI001409C5E8|nr:hypothetical protein [Halorubellus sp. JP-L1]NHN42731.1 hypothetical protein [Halorubellus sp. JP-L1]